MFKSYMEKKLKNSLAWGSDLIQAVEAKMKRARPNKACNKAVRQ